MKSLMIGIGALAMASAFTVGVAAPAAAQMMNGNDRPGIERYGRGDSMPRLDDNRNNDQRDNDRGRFERRGNYTYYNNQRGWSYQRPGYRYYNGFWFPPAAFIAGAVVGGMIATQGDYTTAHMQWCESQYRSYRPEDNTFQPFNGPRQLCVSPYG